MSALKFSVNKAKPAPRPVVSSSKPAFDDSDEESQVAKESKIKKQPFAIVGLNEDLRSYTTLSEETSARMAREALEQDPSGRIPVI